MAFNFPASPTVGQVFEDYVWDGQKWIMTAPGDAVVSPTPPSNPASGDLWWDTSSNTFYVWDGTAWTPTSSAGALTEAPVNNVVYGRRNAAWVPAAATDAYAYSGMQVNGSMEVSQEKGTTGTTLTGTYACDGWITEFAGTAALVALQTTPVIFFVGLQRLMQVSVSTAQTSLAAADRFVIGTRIEGWRVSRLAWGTANAQPVTVGFWVAHARTGTYSLVIRSTNADRSYAATYIQNVADAKEYKTITIPGCVNGTWANDNTIGMHVGFAMACGTTFTAPSANAWVSGNYLAAPGQVNGVAATSDVMRISGVVVLPGTQAPTAAQSPLIMRPYDQELVTCQRYWEKSYNANVAPGTGGGGGSGGVTFMTGTSAAGVVGGTAFFKVRKRAVPTLVTYDNAGVVAKLSAYNGAWASVSPSWGPGIFENAFNIGGSAASSYYILNFDYTADARL